VVEYIVAIDLVRARFLADAFPAHMISLACPGHDSMSPPPGDEGRVKGDREIRGGGRSARLKIVLAARFSRAA
jgi:hypothetical protein